MPKVQSAAIGPLVISDHAPVIQQIADTYPRGSDFTWRFSAYLAKDDSFSDLLRGWWLEYAASNKAHASDPSLYLNAAKAVLRGRIMAFTMSHRKKK